VTSGTAPNPDAVFMPRARRVAYVRALLLVSDILALIFATVAATLSRFGEISHEQQVSELGRTYSIQFVGLAAVVVLLCLIAMAFEHLYDLDRVFWGTGEYTRVLRSISFGVAAFVMLTYLLHFPAISRVWLGLAWVFGIVCAILGRSLVRLLLASSRRRGKLLRPALIVGFNPEAADLMHRLFADTSSGLMPVAYLASSEVDRFALGDFEGAVPCVGTARDVARVLDETYIDTVIVTSTAFDPDVLARIIADMRGREIDIQVSSGLLDITTSRVLVREISGVPLITIRAVSFTPRQRLIKRSFDLLVGGLIALVGMPVWLLIAAMIKLESKGPVFYSQTRIGRSGQPFEMLKFRSMDADAHATRDQLEASNEASGPLFKIQDDPRVTRVGKWLRKFSFDEFPQIVNVLRGEMALVGPRPPLPEESEKYTDHHWRRMEVVPGMTGLWQVSGRSRLTFDEMIRLDLFYIENWSVGFDMSIILRTLPAVILARGSY
jgi:exopolysaccharide biosynthesis polyprenyl glycosylphosphotransferase